MFKSTFLAAAGDLVDVSYLVLEVPKIAGLLACHCSKHLFILLAEDIQIGERSRLAGRSLAILAGRSWKIHGDCRLTLAASRQLRLLTPACICIDKGRPGPHSVRWGRQTAVDLAHLRILRLP